MDKFILCKNYNYIIYGTGGDGLKLFDNLKKIGISVTGYIDKRADEIHSIKNVPVWTMKKFCDLNFCVDKTIIIISIKNVYQHSHIALDLAKKGYKNIIYKPLKIILGQSEDFNLNILSEVFDKLLYGNDIDNDIELIKTDEKINIEFKDKFIINESDNMVTCFLPIELLFNYNNEESFKDINMMAFFPLVELYEAFLNSNNIYYNERLENYIIYASDWLKDKEVKLTDKLKESFINSRYEVFNQMQNIIDINFSYFIEYAPRIKLSCGTHFNLTSSGRNRIAYLIAKGYKHVPVKMTNTDYNNWINYEYLKEFIDKIESLGITKLFSPIPHPFCSNIPVISVDYILLLCKNILNIILKQEYEKCLIQQDDYIIVNNDKFNKTKSNYNIAVFVKDNGCVSRFLLNCGFNVHRYFSKRWDKEQKISLAIDTLLNYTYVNDVNKYIENANENYYDTIIIDTNNDIHENNKLIKMVNKNIILINYNNSVDTLKLCMEKGFTVNKKLFKSIWNEIYTEGILLSKVKYE